MTAKDYLAKVYRHKKDFTIIDLEVMLTSFFNCKRAIILIEANERERVRNSVKYATIKEIIDFKLIDLKTLSPEMKDDLEYRIIEKF